MNRESHWENVYRTRAPTEVSWYTPHLDVSLRLIRDVAAPEARILDVGGGASTLVDDLVAAGYRDISVLDLAGSALDAARERLGEAAARVTWIHADVTTVELPEARFDVWHDRAVFHFLTDEGDRKAYVARLRRSLVSGGHAVISTFAPTGPERCSGLEVRRYDAASLARELGDGFEPNAVLETTHVTPRGVEQRFVTARFRFRGAAP